MALSHNANAPQSPPVFLRTAAGLRECTLGIIDISRRAIDRIVHNNPLDNATFASVLIPWARCRDKLSKEGRILCFYAFVSPDPQLRDESRNSKLLLDDFDTQIYTCENLFRLVNAVAARQETLDAESQRLLEFERRQFTQKGLGIPANIPQDRLKEVQLRLNEVVEQYRKNIDEEDGSISFFPGELAGLTDNFLRGLEQSYEPGKLNVSFSAISYSAVLANATVSETRRRFLTAYNNRCPENVPLFREMVLLRDEAARILGFASHAQLKTQQTIVKSPEDAFDFLDELYPQLRPAAEKELDFLWKLKERHFQHYGMESDGKLYAWDLDFYNRLLLEMEHSFDSNKLAEYFPLQTFVSRTLWILEGVFGVRFQQEFRDSHNTNDTNLAWHADVEIHSVWDAQDRGGSFLGYLYLDLFSRDGKDKNPATFNLQPV